MAPLTNRDYNMRIWKISPTELTDPIWEKWSPEPIIVRAESEREARYLAQLKTTKFLSAIPYQPIALNPWGGYKNFEDLSWTPKMRQLAKVEPCP
jgi:hypothetical protein